MYFEIEVYLRNSRINFRYYTLNEELPGFSETIPQYWSLNSTNELNQLIFD
jgi:hypothetical protein